MEIFLKRPEPGPYPGASLSWVEVGSRLKSLWGLPTCVLKTIVAISGSFLHSSGWDADRKMPDCRKRQGREGSPGPWVSPKDPSMGLGYFPRAHFTELGIKSHHVRHHLAQWL